MKITDEKFWRKTKVEPSGCIRWTGKISKAGYGQVKRRKFQSNDMQAHRYAFYLHNGKFPNEFACHHCDNRWCVNPTHIFDGTQTDNMQDMHRKGRWQPGFQKGSANGSAKLTEEKVTEIKARLSTTTNTRLGVEYGVHHSTVSAIRRGKLWA